MCLWSLHGSQHLTGMIFDITSMQVSVDSLSWDFHVSNLDDSNITDPPKVMTIHACIIMTSSLSFIENANFLDDFC